MKATISDVARRAGVSMKTVSRVLNNEPNVAAKTRERVRAIAQDLQYTPNFAARGLASSKSYLLALMYSNVGPDYIMRVQNGAVDVCREHGYHLVLDPVDLGPHANQAQFRENLEARLKTLPVDGVILTPPLSDSEVVLQVLSKLNIKTVRVGPSQYLPYAEPDNLAAKDRLLQEPTQNRPSLSQRVFTDIPAIFMDDRQAAFDMTTALIKTGHKDIAFIKGHQDHGSSQLRLEGFLAAMEHHSLAVPRARIVQGSYRFQSGIAAANALLSEPNARPTAIFASNDDMAAGVVSAANRLGIAVPDALSVCGFDDMPIAQKMSPQLSSVCQPIYNMGYYAAQSLLQGGKDADQRPQGQAVEYKLIFRGSTARNQS